MLTSILRVNFFDKKLSRGRKAYAMKKKTAVLNAIPVAIVVIALLLIFLMKLSG